MNITNFQVIGTFRICTKQNRDVLLGYNKDEDLPWDGVDVWRGLPPENCQWIVLRDSETRNLAFRNRQTMTYLTMTADGTVILSEFKGWESVWEDRAPPDNTSSFELFNPHFQRYVDAPIEGRLHVVDKPHYWLLLPGS
jgi:hypothetical protein